MKYCLIITLVFSSLLLLPASGHAIDIAVIVHQNNPLNEIFSRDLRRIFKQEKRHWADNRKVYIIMQEDGSSEKGLFVQKIFMMQPKVLKRYWLNKIVKGEILAFPKTLSSNDTVKRFVSQIDASIAYVNANAVDESVKVLRVDGKYPGEKEYFLSGP